MQEFYKMKMYPDGSGISIATITYISVHETPCYHFCVVKDIFTPYKPNYLELKNIGYKFTRVMKNNCSRIAFDTKQKAFAHLCMLKRKQLVHLKHTVKLIELFNKSVDENDYKPESFKQWQNFTDTKEVINTFCLFD